MERKKTRNEKKTMKGKEKKTMKGKRKNGGPRGCPPVRCRHKFFKRKKKKING